MEHVLGLEHEHLRYARGFDVHFNCAGFTSYNRVKKEIDNHSEWNMKLEDFCNHFYLGATHGLDWRAPGDFTTHMGSEAMYDVSTYHYQHFFSWTYDHDSIMQYSLRTGWGKDPNCDVTTYPLVKWKVRFPPSGTIPIPEDTELIPQVTGVSEGDAAGIRHLYPWLGN